MRYLGWWLGLRRAHVPAAAGGQHRHAAHPDLSPTSSAMFAMSWDFLSGRTGYISFGHPFLIGIAGYTTAILSFRFDVPIYYSIPAAIVATMVGGTLFFLPALRIRGTYFALVTLAFMEILYQLTKVVAPKITGGTRGISGLESHRHRRRQQLLPELRHHVRDRRGALAADPHAARRIALSAIRMNEEAVRSTGHNTTKLKLFAFSGERSGLRHRRRLLCPLHRLDRAARHVRDQLPLHHPGGGAAGRGGDHHRSRSWAPTS